MTQNGTYTPQAETLLAGYSNVGAQFSSISQAYGDHLAIVDGERSLTFEELDQRSNKMANALKAQGLKVGERVAILARNCQEYLELEIAAAKLGVIVAALNWRLTDRELAYCIKLVEPELIILQPEYAEVVERLGLASVPVWQIGADLDQRIEQQSKSLERIPIDSEAGLVILYTSGTTGMPKGALISHRAMVARAALFAADLHLEPQAGFIAWAPLFHMASTDQGLATLLRGGTVYVVDGYQPERLMDLIETTSIGWFVLMPGMVGDFAARCLARNVKPFEITVCGAMADLVPRQEIAAATKALNAPYVNSFGATETGLAPASVSLIPIGEAPAKLPKRQNAMVEVRLVDSEGNDVATGQPGEVALRGPTLFSGYWNAQETNAHDFRNGWFHMGDVMRRNADGTLDYVDRVKYMIKSGGENIYPAEIEQVILSDDRINEAVVVRKTDPKWGEVPIVFIVAGRSNMTAKDVLSICDGQLSRYKIPKEIHFIDDADLPRSTTGKIQRHKLKNCWRGSS